MQTDSVTTTRERADFLDSLAHHRGLLLRTVQGMTDEKAGLHPTVSELCLGGIVKHVALMEERWVDFILEGPDAIGPADAAAYGSHLASFLMDGATLGELVARYGEVARRTDELVVSLPSLDDEHPLPEAPWFEAGASWSARRTLLHIIAETAQHAGHADPIRETIDGAKTMG
jgi:uncharacterized damage-inducible protein DinB